MSDLVGERIALDLDAVVWREVDDEVIILELATAVYLTLNGSARLLWLRLDQGATEDELAEVLAETYDIAIEQAAVDTRAFLDALRERSLLKVGESPNTSDTEG